MGRHGIAKSCNRDAPTPSPAAPLYVIGAARPVHSADLEKYRELPNHRSGGREYPQSPSIFRSTGPFCTRQRRPGAPPHRSAPSQCYAPTNRTSAPRRV
ncbi:unnamed protein product [Euphydryas editha]|uniref:Uncharacterized protein n=1 Tax=Euphydryas editha TaxID=104508 RepID=A0AAU9TA40_EUPED|nr:unnamed protein product [Euphydryas editha]